MKPVAIIYATREGHTRRIAEHAIAALTRLGYSCCAWNLQDHPKIDLTRHSAAILASSVRSGKHEAVMLDFVEHHIEDLERLPNAFLSVTLSQAGVERPGQPPETASRCRAGVNQAIDRFVAETGWCPQHIEAIAGALTYSKYNFVTRCFMQWTAGREGADTDTSRDYEYTDWNGLARFIAKFAFELRENTELDAGIQSQRSTLSTITL